MTTTTIPIMAGPRRSSYFDWRSWVFWLLVAVWSIPLLWLNVHVGSLQRRHSEHF